MAAPRAVMEKIQRVSSVPAVSEVCHRYPCQMSVISGVDRAKERPHQWAKLGISMEWGWGSQTKSKIRYIAKIRLTDVS